MKLQYYLLLLYNVKNHVFDELNDRFEDIYIFYDNDFDKEENWGQLFAQKFKESFKVFEILIDDKYECKDYSDFIKKYGQINAKKLIKSQIIPF